MGNRDKAAKVPAAAVSSKTKRGRQNKNIRNGIFMPPPAGMEDEGGVSKDTFLTYWKKRARAGTAKTLLTTT